MNKKNKALIIYGVRVMALEVNGVIFQKKNDFFKHIFYFMFIVHELLESGEVWPIPSENIGSEGSKTGCLPI